MGGGEALYGWLGGATRRDSFGIFRRVMRGRFAKGFIREGALCRGGCGGVLRGGNSKALCERVIWRERYGMSGRPAKGIIHGGVMGRRYAKGLGKCVVRAEALCEGITWGRWGQS